MDRYRPERHPFNLAQIDAVPINSQSAAATQCFTFARNAQRRRFAAALLALLALAPAGSRASAPDSTAFHPAAAAAGAQISVSAAEPVRTPADIAAEIIAAASASFNLRTAAPSAFQAKSDTAAPEIIATAALDRFRLELEEKIQAISGPDSTYYQPFAGLKAGARDVTAHGPVTRMQKALLQWNAKLPLKANGIFDEATLKSLTLFKLVYDLGHDGSLVDQPTAGYLLAIEEGIDANLDEPQGITGRLVYHAAQFLGLRYRLGGDGKKTTDCGMLTRMAMIGAGMVDEVFNRVAATQYKYAEQGQMGLTLVDKNEEPAPGDLVFFKWNTRRARYRYKGITHVGIFLGKVGESLYVLEAHSARSDRKVTILDRAGSIRRIAGYGRFTAPPEDDPIDGAIEMTD